MSSGRSIAKQLDGQHVLLTGVTGFVGEALLQLMLTDVPGVRVTLLVRPKGSTSGKARIAGLLGKPIFADVVASAGGVEALMVARVSVLEGDLADVPALPTDLDAVVHCAWRDPMNWSTRYESAGWVGLVQVAAYSAGVRSPSEECGR